MSRIEDLVAELCPGGVRFGAVNSLVDVVPTARGVHRENYGLGSASPIIDQGQSLIAGYTDDATIVLPAGEYIVFGDHTRAVKWVDFGFAPGADGTKVLRAAEGLLPKFAYYSIANLEIPSRGYNRHWTVLRELRIPVPPLQVQQEIVRILDNFTELEAELGAELGAELEARRGQYDHYRRSMLSFGSDVPWRPLGGLADNLDNMRKPVTRAARIPGEIPYYGASGVVDYVSDFIFDGDYLLVSEDGANLLARSTPIAFSITGKTWVNNHAHVLRFGTYAERRFVEIYLNSIDLSPFVSGATQPKLNKSNLTKIPVPDPSLDEKERIVAALDKFEALVNDLSIGLPAELTARRKQYGYYRNRLLTFEEAAA